MVKFYNQSDFHQWRSQSAASARVQHGRTTFEPRKQLRESGDAPPENFGIFELPRSILRLL